MTNGPDRLEDHGPHRNKNQAVLFDWGNTVMRNFPASKGPMHLWPRVEPIVGIRSALTVMTRSSIVALATNAADSHQTDIRHALDRCELSSFFDEIFCFRQVGYRKPEPGFFLSILGHLNLPPSAVFMVGDSYEDDVRAANDQGIAAVWFNPASTRLETGPLFRTIRQHQDLPSALRQLGAKVY